MKFSSSIIILAILTFCGCKAIDELTHFDIDYNYIVNLPAFNGIVLPEEIESSDVENNTESTFENNDTRKDLVERATLKKLNVTIIEPENGTFDFVNRVDIFVNTTNSEEVLMAWKYDIDAAVGNHLELETTNRDLKKYLTSDKIRVRLKTTSVSPIRDDHKIDLEATVEVDAKILGI